LDQKLGLESAVETRVVPSEAKSSGIGRLTVVADQNAEQQEFQLSEGALTIGRKAKVSTAAVCIQTSDKTMSRSHVRIDVKKDPKNKGYLHYLSDNNSKNRTLYNGKYIESGDVVILKDNDEIVLGRTIIRFNE
jgi:pSer/pThr/pTyr-binding forkhead associated (FHA) protein